MRLNTPWRLYETKWNFSLIEKLLCDAPPLPNFVRQNFFFVFQLYTLFNSIFYFPKHLGSINVQSTYDSIQKQPKLIDSDQTTPQEFQQIKNWTQIQQTHQELSRTYIQWDKSWLVNGWTNPTLFDLTCLCRDHSRQNIHANIDESWIII